MRPRQIRVNPGISTRTQVVAHRFSTGFPVPHEAVRAFLLSFPEYFDQGRKQVFPRCSRAVSQIAGQPAASGSRTPGLVSWRLSAPQRRRDLRNAHAEPLGHRGVQVAEFRLGYVQAARRDDRAEFDQDRAAPVTVRRGATRDRRAPSGPGARGYVG